MADPDARAAYDRRLRRQAEVRRAAVRREIAAVVETAAEYVRYRAQEAPRVVWGAALFSFVLV